MTRQIHEPRNRDRFRGYFALFSAEVAVGIAGEGQVDGDS